MNYFNSGELLTCKRTQKQRYVNLISGCWLIRKKCPVSWGGKGQDMALGHLWGAALGLCSELVPCTSSCSVLVPGCGSLPHELCQSNCCDILLEITSVSGGWVKNNLLWTCVVSPVLWALVSCWQAGVCTSGVGAGRKGLGAWDTQAGLAACQTSLTL